MKTHTFTPGSGKESRILIGETIDAVGNYIPSDKSDKTIIITDESVNTLYGSRLPQAPVIEIGAGEGTKTLETVQDVYKQLMEHKADRSSFILGVGGGIVCDVAGFCASTYMRGISFGFAPTTLLAQVDASVGGKNGVNLGGFKNIVGVVRQPEFVLLDLTVLKTLKKDDILCGTAEIVKHGAILDQSLFAYLEENHRSILALDTKVLERPVYDSVILKSGVVERDENENGERKKLNFGHTFGHALEKALGIPHGKAVALGMAAAAYMSVMLGFLNAEAYDRLIKLLESLDLPTKIALDPETLIQHLDMDKKRHGKDIHFVLLKNIGDSFIHPVDLTDSLCKKDVGIAFSSIQE